MEKKQQLSPNALRLDRPQPPARLEQLSGLFATVATAPTGVPRTLFDQVKIFNDGVNIRLYIYDITNNAWRYSALT